MKNNFFLTVMGRNDKGIIAVVSAILLAYEISINDITQKILGDNFVLMMELSSEKNVDLQVLQGHLEESTKQFRMKFMLAHEDLFTSTHRL